MGAVWVITGPIGSGKSTVARLLADCGARVLDADAMVHRLLARHEKVHAGLRELFGEEVFGEDGKPDRKRIAARVFEQPERLKALEQLLHPFVLADLAEEAADWRAKGKGPLFMEVVLWFQQDATPFPVDGVLLTWAPREVLIDRVVGTRDYDREEVGRRLDSQGDWDELSTRADRVLNTDCSLPVLAERVRLLYRLLS